jgi:hypothetical protein
MAINLKTKPGINGANMLSIPATWDPTWFRHFVNNSLKGADVRNAVGINGVTITGNISSPYATISGSGAGGVTTVASPGGTITVTNPTGPTVDLALPASGVTAGSFTSANITVNAEGIVTAAANGSGGGGSTPFNVTPDTHAALPTGVGLGPNDEFETGTSIDTAGTRYSGATAWNPFNLSTGSSQINNGSLILLPALTTSLSLNGFVQPVPAGSWTYTAKIATQGPNSSSLLGMIVATSAGATGNLYSFNLNLLEIEVQSFSNATTFVSTLNGLSNATINVSASTSPVVTYPVYMQISFNGTNLVFSYSTTGIGAFTVVETVAASTFLGTPGLIGLAGSLRSTSQGLLISDWFRRTG